MLFLLLDVRALSCHFSHRICLASYRQGGKWFQKCCVFRPPCRKQESGQLYLGIGAYFPWRMLTISSLSVEPLNGLSCEHSSYRMQPQDHMSLWVPYLLITAMRHHTRLCRAPNSVDMTTAVSLFWGGTVFESTYFTFFSKLKSWIIYAWF